MSGPSLRRTTLAELSDDELAVLVRHGEDDFVERKRQPPSGTKLGAVAASFANTLGGWILLGVADDGSITGWELQPPKTDLQSHLANLLRGQVDPVPPFVAAYRTLDGKRIAVMRVFESADVPHVERGSGAIYVRAASGKVPLDSHGAVLALAQRGRDAERSGRDRLKSSWMVQSELAPPDVDSGRIARVSDPRVLAVTVRAAPLTVTPAFTAWPISGAAAQAGSALTRVFADGTCEPVVTPRARGVVVRGEVTTDFGRSTSRIAVVIDSLGVVAVALTRTATAYQALDVVRRDMIGPAIDAVCHLLTEAEAVGRTAMDMWLGARKDVITSEHPQANPRAMEFHVASEIVVPAEEDERGALGRRWEREIARELGDARWENEDA